MSVTDAIQEILTDIQNDQSGTMRRATYLEDAMPGVTGMLEATHECATPLVVMASRLEGLNEDEIGAAVRRASLSGAFVLGCLIGQELQKRGYVPPVDASLDQPL